MEEILHQLRLVVSPIIYELFTSQVVQDFLHQQYDTLLGSKCVLRKGLPLRSFSGDLIETNLG